MNGVLCGALSSRPSASSGRNPSPSGLSMLGCWPEAAPVRPSKLGSNSLVDYSPQSHLRFARRPRPFDLAYPRTSVAGTTSRLARTPGSSITIGCGMLQTAGVAWP